MRGKRDWFGVIVGQNRVCHKGHNSAAGKRRRVMFDALKNLFPGLGISAAGGLSDTALQSRWQRLEAAGRELELFVPAGSESIAGVVLFLHGHGEVLLSGNPVFTRLFQQHRLVAVCPSGRRSWWLDVVCEEFDPVVTPQQWLVQSLVPWIEQRLEVQPPRIALLGVSMGGQGVLQLAYRYALKFPVVAAISPAVDFHQLYGAGIPLDGMFPDAEAARQATVVLNLHPLQWPRYQYFCCDPADVEWYDGAARLGMKLSSSGILHERDLLITAGGHTWSYFNRMAEPAIEHVVRGLAGVAASVQ
jgi:poly(3-hydroxybutyrate) depolymerase